MAETDSLTYCLDETVGDQLPAILRQLRAPGAPGIHGVRELGLGSVTDAVLFDQLRTRNVGVMVTRDSRILNASVRRDAWRASGVTLFVCDSKWGNLPLFQLASRHIVWWPRIVEQAQTGPQGAAWRLPLNDGAMVRLFADLTAVR
jgi:hypothetical protein